MAELENQSSIMQKAFKAAFTYPPMNLRKEEENKYVLEFAVAGFGKQDITIETEGSTLKISGAVNKEDEEDDLLYKGISTRDFSHKFKMVETMVVQNAEIVNGVLKVFMENVIPESQKPRKIEIKE